MNLVDQREAQKEISKKAKPYTLSIRSYTKGWILYLAVGKWFGFRREHIFSDGEYRLYDLGLLSILWTNAPTSVYSPEELEKVKR